MGSCIWRNNILRYKTVRPVPNSRNRSTINDHRSNVSFVYFCSFLGETIDHRSDHQSDHRSPINNHRSPVYVLSTETIVRSPIVDQKTPIADRSNRQSTYLVRRLSCDLDYRSPIKKTD